MDLEGHIDAVFLVLHVGSGHLDVHEALVQAIGGDGVGVTLQVLFLEHAGTGEPGEDVAGLQGQVLVHVALVQLLQAVDLDFLDIELVAFFHLDDQHGAAAAGAAVQTVAGAGQVIAFLAVELVDLLQVVGDELFVEHVAGLGAHGGDHVLGIDLVAAFHDDVLDAGLFRHGEDQHVAFHVGLDVAEVAQFPDALDFFVDVVGRGSVAFADGKAHEDYFGVHDLQAAHLHVGQGALGGAHGHEVGAADGVGGFGAGSAAGRRGRSRSIGTGQHAGSLTGHGGGAFIKAQQGGTVEVGRPGLTFVHRHQQGLQGKAFAVLREAAEQHQVGSRFLAQFAGGGHVDAAAAGGQQAAGLVHGDDGQTALLHLRTDDLRHVPGRVGHLRAGSDLEGQHQHRVSRGLQRGGSPQAGQQGETEQAQPITQMFFHTESPLSVPDYDSW